MRASVGAEVERLRPLSRGCRVGARRQPPRDAQVPRRAIRRAARRGRGGARRGGGGHGPLRARPSRSRRLPRPRATAHPVGGNCGGGAFGPRGAGPPRGRASSAAVFPASARPGIPISPSAGSSTSAPGVGKRASPCGRPSRRRPVVSFGTLAVSRLALMRSDLSPRGARYRKLASAELTPGRSGASASGRPAGPREADLTDHVGAQ